MTHKLTLVCLSAALCTGAALAQARVESTTALPETTSTSPSAWVYIVSQNTTNGKNDIYALQAASDGTLTSISGSPFQDDVNQIAVNGKYLFGGLGSGTNIDAYHMGSNGALSLWQSSQAFAPNCGEIGPMFTDHTGATLYMWNYDGDSSCSAATFDAYAVDSADGKLSSIGTAGDNRYLPFTLSFTGNNEFAYAGGYPIWGFKRNSNGTLTQLNINPAMPSAPANEGYVAYPLGAADPTTHVVIPVQLFDNGNVVGASQLAVYSANSSGNLTTTSTYSNMSSVAVGAIGAISISPSGELLAVAGTKGLQIFHVNGANPLTKYTGLLTTDAANQVSWDKNNHLYAAFGHANKLRVYTITPTSYSEAKGSPRVIADPVALSVQTLPR